MQRATQISIDLPNVPGSLARVSDALRGVKINIVAICCTQHNSTTTLHLVVSDTESATVVLKPLGKVKCEEVLAFSMKDKPGSIFAIARACAAAGVNIRNICSTSHRSRTEAMLYLLVDDIERAESAFRSKPINGL